MTYFIYFLLLRFSCRSTLRVAINKVEGVPYPENAQERDEAKTSYFELVPAEVSLIRGM